MRQIRASFIILLVSTVLISFKLAAQQVDQELLGSLKLEATHDLERLKSLKSERSNQKIYDNEREKGLGSFLEEQEKWDLLREKGLAEYRKQKKLESPRENGPEHQQDIKEKKQASQQMEKSRQILVQTKTKVFSQNKELILNLENDELGLNQKRPRYDLRKRGHNKWVKNTTPGAKAPSTPSYTPPPAAPSFEDFPPPPPVPDYQPIPNPVDGFEEIPPPPPPPVYESYGAQPGAGGYDPAFGDFPPPPPPPPPDFDF